MAHDITATDGLVLHRQPAWHGLGVVVQDAPSPAEALALAKLDWLVEQWPLNAARDARSIPVLTHVLNVRGDNHQALGVVGNGYRPVQNAELADFASQLGGQGKDRGDIEVESAGSIRGGRRVWFLLRGKSIWPHDADEVRPYLLIANSHDGTLAMTCQPTTIRVVCKNTLHASLRQGEQSTLTVRFRHEGQVVDKLEAAKRALGLFTEARASFQEQAHTLQARQMTREDLQRFWLEVYKQTLGEIPKNPATEEEQTRQQRAQRILGKWAFNFDQELGSIGATRWAAFNAVSRWLDHDRPVRAPSDAMRRDNRMFNNWWGDSAAAKTKALAIAIER
jgi:phage/plasmid-like protein (TIGR03299 family)